MILFLPVIFLLCISQHVFGQRIQLEKSDFDYELSYQEFINVSDSCHPRDLCIEDRTDDPPISDLGYRCSCNQRCWELGTCCIDSPFRDKSPTHRCRKIRPLDSVGYYIVDRCPDNTNIDSIWKIQCEKEWKDEDDILLLSPATSLDTSVTYKNYFCFRCHEKTDKYISWNLFVESIYNASGERNISSISYDQEQKNWVAILDGDHISIPVNLSFMLPNNMYDKAYYCDQDIISDCPDTWTDRRVREICLAYTAVVYQGSSPYKNVHCALCNYESVDALTCNRTGIEGMGGAWLPEGKEPYSFRATVDINFSQGEKVGDDGKCDSNQLWDPYSKICRKKTCALPGYVLQDNKCVLP